MTSPAVSIVIIATTSVLVVTKVVPCVLATVPGRHFIVKAFLYHIDRSFSLVVTNLNAFPEKSFPSNKVQQLSPGYSILGVKLPASANIF